MINSLSTKQFILIEADQLGALASLMFEEFKKFQEASNDSKQELPARLVRKALLAKGYRLKSDSSFISFVKNHELTRKKRGREFWYLKSEIESIPSKISNHSNL